MGAILKGLKKIDSHKTKPKSFRLLILLGLCLIIMGCFNTAKDSSKFPHPPGNITVSFAVASDMRNFSDDTPSYFRGACERLAAGGPGSFLISVGDIDPPAQVYSTIKKYIGSNYVWYPIVGNHETETAEDMDWLRTFNPTGNLLPNIVKAGPVNGLETTYSFNYGNVHFILLNEYYDGAYDTGTDGDVTDSLYNWLIADLEANTKPVVLVLGHEPAYPLPDEESGSLRHLGDSLDKYPANRDRFWTALATYSVKAYICGHTHNYSISKINQVWQVDSGHARGSGDTTSRSTFMMFYITDDHKLWRYTYRLNLVNLKYELVSSGVLD
ncbi:MAG TPA: metallophosphoesterase [Bacillota bacterium]|nr:metallophosphoesterase [Bacillota bacterium]